jgi:transposase-like protein
MKKYTRYSEDFKERALAKVYSRGNERSIQGVADDLNINLQTLKKWMKKSGSVAKFVSLRDNL